jgi:hypothetical protein
MGQLLIIMEGSLRFLEKKCNNFLFTARFCMKDFLIVYNCGEVHKKLEIKIIKYRYVSGCPKRLATQIGSLKI